MKFAESFAMPDAFWAGVPGGSIHYKPVQEGLIGVDTI
jgi:hypothetical protein